MTNSKINLMDLFLSRQNELLAKHTVIKKAFDHPSMDGDATEQSWLDLLVDFLPRRYCVSSGKVVDSEGNVSDQIDIIIFDQHFSPILFRDRGKCIVPAESVYCIFEVKPNFNKDHVEYAANKLCSVRSLKRTAVKIPVAGDGMKETKHVEISGGILCSRSDWKPAYGKPFQTLVNSFTAEGRLDIGCTLEAGSFYTDSNSNNLITSSKEICLIAFLSNLMLKLQAKGTAGAIDYKAYSAKSLGI